MFVSVSLSTTEPTTLILPSIPAIPLKIGTHRCLCPRAVFTVSGHGRQKWHPCPRPVHTACRHGYTVYRELLLDYKLQCSVFSHAKTAEPI